MKLIFLTVSHKFPPWLEVVAQDYKSKISYWFKVEVQNLKPSSHGRDVSEKKKSDESRSLESFIKKDDYVVACDENGKKLNSIEFSKGLEKILASGKKRLIVIVGGAYGLEESLIGRADLVLSLSNFTMNHNLALGVILEQVYRGMTLIKGIKYHNV